MGREAGGVACKRDTRAGVGKGHLSPLHTLLPPTGALELGQALPIHSGRYTCTARNSAGVAHKHMVLTVQGKHLLAGGELEAGRAE